MGIQIGQKKKGMDIVRVEEYSEENVLDFIINFIINCKWVFQSGIIGVIPCVHLGQGRCRENPLLRWQSIGKRQGLGLEWKSQTKTFKPSQRKCQVSWDTMVFWYIMKKIIIGDPNKQKKPTNSCFLPQYGEKYHWNTT